MQHDTSHIRAEHLPDIESKQADHSRRRAAVTAAAARAGAGLQAAREKINQLSASLAAGEADAKAAVAANEAMKEAEGHAAVAQNALELLDIEAGKLDAEHKAASRMKSIADYRLKVAKAKSAAQSLDEAAATFNAAYDAWKAARVDAFTSFPQLGEHFGTPRIFPMVGAGVMGSTSLHTEVVNDLSRLVGSPPARVPVANSEVPLV